MSQIYVRISIFTSANNPKQSSCSIAPLAEKDGKVTASFIGITCLEKDRLCNCFDRASMNKCWAHEAKERETKKRRVVEQTVHTRCILKNEFYTLYTRQKKKEWAERVKVSHLYLLKLFETVSSWVKVRQSDRNGRNVRARVGAPSQENFLSAILNV